MKLWAGIIGISILLGVQAAALDIDADSYGSITDYLHRIYGGPDENAGLTAFPILTIPLGGQAEGRASSFAAISDDSSFLEINPAGSSMLSKTELAFFHNNWIADARIEGAVFASRWGDLGFAAGGKWLYTPFTEYNIYGERASKGYYSEGVVIFNSSYNFLAGYYFSGLSLGVNLKGAFRFVPDFSNADDSEHYTGELIPGSGSAQSAVMAMADVGLLTRFNFIKLYSAREQNTSAALVIRNLGPPVMGDPMPTTLTAALSYRPLRPLLLSFDYSLPLNLLDPELSEKPYWSAGFSAVISRFLSMRTGLLFKTGNVRIVLGSAVILNRVTLDINYTLDLLTQLTPLNRISLAVRLDLGDQGRKARSDQVDAAYLSGLEAYANGDLAGAQEYWETALQLNPRFDPAQEGLAILRHGKALEDRINNLQSIDF